MEHVMAWVLLSPVLDLQSMNIIGRLENLQNNYLGHVLEGDVGKPVGDILPGLCP